MCFDLIWYQSCIIGIQWILFQRWKLKLKTQIAQDWGTLSLNLSQDTLIRFSILPAIHSPSWNINSCRPNFNLTRALFTDSANSPVPAILKFDLLKVVFPASSLLLGGLLLLLKNGIFVLRGYCVASLGSQASNTRLGVRCLGTGGHRQQSGGG